jgi:hypothetical protein
MRMGFLQLSTLVIQGETVMMEYFGHLDWDVGWREGVSSYLLVKHYHMLLLLTFSLSTSLPMSSSVV